MALFNMADLRAQLGPGQRLLGLDLATLPRQALQAMTAARDVDTMERGGSAAVQGVVKKWGNGAAVRIPAAVLEAAQVHLNQPVDVREEGGRIIIEPIHPAVYDIDSLVAGITDENRHDEVDIGPATGKEIW